MGTVAMGNQYDRREMEEILRRALEKGNDDAVTHEELVAAAAEVGISAEAIEEAAASLRADRVRLEKRAQLLVRSRGRFLRHVMTYLTINLGLVALDIIDRGPQWFYFPLIGWGIFLAMHALRTYMPDEDRLNRRIDKELRRDELRKRGLRPHRWGQLHQGASHTGINERLRRSKQRSDNLQRIIDDSIDLALGRVADQLGRRFRVQPPDDPDDPNAEPRNSYHRKR